MTSSKTKDHNLIDYAKQYGLSALFLLCLSLGLIFSFALYDTVQGQKSAPTNETDENSTQATSSHMEKTDLHSDGLEDGEQIRASAQEKIFASLPSKYLKSCLSTWKSLHLVDSSFVGLGEDKLFLYTAYIDGRKDIMNFLNPGESTLRVIALFSSAVPNVDCEVIDDHGKVHMSNIVSSSVQRFDMIKSDAYQTVIINFPLPSFILSGLDEPSVCAVNINFHVDTPVPHVSDAILPVRPGPLNHMLSFHPVEYEHKFGICVDIRNDKLVYDKYRMIEWIDLNFHLGVSVIFLYISDGSSFYEYFTKEENNITATVKLYTIPWNMPSRETRNLAQDETSTILTSMVNDCIYRASRITEYVFPSGLYELLVPTAEVMSVHKLDGNQRVWERLWEYVEHQRGTPFSLETQSQDPQHKAELAAVCFPVALYPYNVEFQENDIDNFAFAKILRLRNYRPSTSRCLLRPSLVIYATMHKIVRAFGQVIRMSGLGTVHSFGECDHAIEMDCHDVVEDLSITHIYDLMQYDVLPQQHELAAGISGIIEE